MQMDYIAGSFYDGFLLYAMALEETLADGGMQNDGINITVRTQNRRFWGKDILIIYISHHLFRPFKSKINDWIACH